MKKWKRRLSNAFRPAQGVTASQSALVNGTQPSPMKSVPIHRHIHNENDIANRSYSSGTLTDSMCDLAERLYHHGVIMENDDKSPYHVDILNANHPRITNGHDCAMIPPAPRPPGLRPSMTFEPEEVVLRSKKSKNPWGAIKRTSWHNSKNLSKSSSNSSLHNARNTMCVYWNVAESKWNPTESAAQTQPRRMDFSNAAVRERAMGSDGESIEASPCTSDEVASPDSSYTTNVKMRLKTTRRWSEQDIQKRLSLPADLRLPLSVVEKMNRTPTLDQPLTRKNRRVSLSEIGFGKLETYQKLEKLGEGTYATVFKGRSRLTNNLVALKEIRLEQEEGAPCTAIREVSLLRDLKHANVVTLHDIIHTERTLTLVFEFVDRDLKNYMDSCSNILSINNVRLFLFQLLRGLAYCHQRRVLHRDLKPQNLLINTRGDLKLADFGLARAKSVPTKTYSHEVVTLWYRPPDVLLGCTDYSTPIDMWGVGCILYEMATGRPFFPGSNTEEQLHLIFRALGTPRLELHPDVAGTKEFQAYRFPSYRPEPLVNHAPRLDIDGLDMLAQLLQYEGRKRLQARIALTHPFFSSLPQEVHNLTPIESIFCVAGITLTHDPGFCKNPDKRDPKLNAALNSKNRRCSMLL